MPRPRADGTRARAPERRALTDRFVRTVRPDPAERRLYWDVTQPGLALSVEPTGFRAYKLVYRFGGRARWYTVGDARKIGLKDARDVARDKMADVVKGRDPAAERKAVRRAGTFEDLSGRYFTEYASKRNRSWKQPERLIAANVLPVWKHRFAADLRRSDVRQLFRNLTDNNGPVLANQVLSAVSAIYAWALREEILDLAGNPCSGIERNPTKARDRYLSEAELRAVWPEFEAAGEEGRVLRAIVLCGQRPGEVLSIDWANIDGSWWEIPASGYKTNKAHRVFLSEPVLALLGEQRERGRVFQVTMHKVQLAAQAVGTALKLPPFHPHDLRATCASHLSAMGIARDTISRVLGHAEGGTTSRYVRHGYDNEKMKAMTTSVLH